ncbi:invasion associated locus B family protein [uncultured Oxalicibacterium sp.]|uniref:invasion associated locus B family protein n=1 Tax=uncultured Oxalicibacterium sp. TaxID=1168540 RepID=UPI0025EB490C|nr:invasion associated locus B family protein [uncultured Oxalicibacterium sp.]
MVRSPMAAAFSLLTFAAVLGMAATAYAQTPAASANASAAPAWKQKAKHGNWEVICAKVGEKDTCQAIQLLETKNEKDPQAAGQRVLRLVAQKGPEGMVFSFELPFGIDLRPGIVYQVDGGAETTLPFLTCIPAGCLVSMALTDPVKKQLTGGKQMKVGFRPLGSEKVMVLDVKLDGLGKALAAL